MYEEHISSYRAEMAFPNIPRTLRRAAPIIFIAGIGGAGAAGLYHYARSEKLPVVQRLSLAPRILMRI